MKLYPELVEACKQAASNQGLLPGENNIFITKCIQYKELLDVRHSVFIMGAAGTGKSSVWKTLAASFAILGDKTVCGSSLGFSKAEASLWFSVIRQ